MEKSYKYRVYPTKEQQVLLTKTFGCVRWVYNHYLDRKIVTLKTEHRYLDYKACSKDLTRLKKDTDWLREVDAHALQNSLRDLEKAYKRYFSNKPVVGFPKYKSRKNMRWTYRTNDCVYYHGSSIFIPKVGELRTRNKFVPEGRIVNATVEQVPSGKYYVILCCTDVDIKPLPKTGKTVGLEVGDTGFITTSDGVRIYLPDSIQKSLDRLVRLQRSYARKTKGSHNHELARRKVARQFERVLNQRRDFLQKLSTRLIRGNDTISLKDFSIKELMESGRFPRTAIGTGLSDFVRELEYKSEWYGRELRKV